MNIEFFKKKENTDSNDMKEISEKLDKIAIILESNIEFHKQIPDLIWKKIIVEINQASNAALAAAWITIRRKVWEEISKWAWRAILGFMGIKALEYFHTSLSFIHSSPGITP